MNIVRLHLKTTTRISFLVVAQTTSLLMIKLLSFQSRILCYRLKRNMPSWNKLSNEWRKKNRWDYKTIAWDKDNKAWFHSTKIINSYGLERKCLQQEEEIKCQHQYYPNSTYSRETTHSMNYKMTKNRCVHAHWLKWGKTW